MNNMRKLAQRFAMYTTVWQTSSVIFPSYIIELFFPAILTYDHVIHTLCLLKYIKMHFDITVFVSSLRLDRVFFICSSFSISAPFMY